jgi:sugar lactone lactonase YvrE
MDLAKMLALIAANSLIGWRSAHAQERCPAVPFETDVATIVAAMAADPVKPLEWYADETIAGRFRVSEGAVQSAGGGLGGHGQISMWYDAKHYVSVWLDTSWPPPPNFGFLEGTSKPLPLMSNQLVRKISDRTYTLTVARPTPEEAREFACVANQLLVIPPPKPAPADAPQSSLDSSREVVVTASRRTARCDLWFSDGAYNNYGISTSTPGFRYDPDLSCADSRKLENRTQQIAYGPIAETFERRDGTWRPPQVRNLTVDVADNLYMLLSPVSKRNRQLEVRKLMSSGETTSLKANAAEIFDVAGLVIDAAGHEVVVANENFGSVVLDLTSRTSFPVSGSGREGFTSAAIDAHQALFATSLSAVYRVLLTGEATQLADLSGHAADTYAPDRYHLAVAPDGRLLLSDATLNVIETVTAEGGLMLVAGIPGKAGSNDGAALRAAFNAPRGLAVGRDGAIYVCDSGNHTIRRINTDGKVSTITGKPGKRATTDGRGAAARFDSPESIAIDSTGVLYVTNGFDNLIRKISPAGVVSTFNAR